MPPTISVTRVQKVFRYSLGRSTSPMAVAAYTYDKLPAAEQQALPDAGHLVGRAGMGRTRIRSNGDRITPTNRDLVWVPVSRLSS